MTIKITIIAYPDIPPIILQGENIICLSGHGIRYENIDDITYETVKQDYKIVDYIA